MKRVSGSRARKGISQARVGALNEDLGQAIRAALRCDPLAAAVYGAGYSWDRATGQFLSALAEAEASRAQPATSRYPRKAVPA